VGSRPEPQTPILPDRRDCVLSFTVDMENECAVAEMDKRAVREAVPVDTPAFDRYSVTSPALRSAGNLAVQRRARQEAAAPASGGTHKHGGGHSSRSGGRSIQREGACGGTCSECSGQSPAKEPPVFDRHSQQNLGGNMAAQRNAKDTAAAQPAAKTGTAGAADPAVPDYLSEASCVTENLDEENRLSYTSPGKIAARTSPPPTAISFFNYGNDQPTPKPAHVRYLSMLRPLLARNGVAVRVVGRASCPGKAAHNLDLSQNRAEIVADLLKPGVRVVEVKGVGESQPVADNSTVEGRSRNRAVDIIPLPPPVPPLSLCKIFPALCQVPPPPPPRKFCEKNPELCQIPDFCRLFPALCQECMGDDCDDDHDHRTFCENHPVFCILAPLCILAPEICLACMEDPALCVGGLECILNPAACTSPPRPPKPPKPTTPVTVQFTPVRALNTPAGANDRIPDKGTTAVAAIVTGWKPPMPPIRIRADGAHGVNGDFVINGADEVFITGSTIFQVAGIDQTSPTAPLLPLSLLATMGPTPVGHSSPFAVADLMENIDIDLEALILTNPSLLDALQNALTGVRVIQSDSMVGMLERMSWDSDGAEGMESLDQVRVFGVFHERAASGSWKPLQGRAHGGWGNTPLSFYFAEDVPLGGPGRRQAELLWVQEDRRSHSQAVVTKSGFEIDEVLEQDPLRSGCMRLLLTHKGSAVSVQGLRSDAGSGTAGATIPLDCEFQCGSRQLPDTQAHWTGADRGETMTANPLTRCGPPGSDPSIRLPGWQCIRDAGDSAFWREAHLLHGVTGKDDLHGPGNEAKNLIITDGSLNTLMSARVEQDAIRRVHRQSQTLSYRVEALPVANIGDRRYFADGMRIDLDRIDPVTRTVTDRIFHGTIVSGKPRPIPPNCT
jgi:outer membrane protein OmpA-like peptidoglycan-associated protein